MGSVRIDHSASTSFDLLADKSFTTRPSPVNAMSARNLENPLRGAYFNCLAYCLFWRGTCATDIPQESPTFFQLSAPWAYRAVCLQVLILEVRPEVTISRKAS